MGLSRVQVSTETVVTSGTSGTATLTGVAYGNLLVAYPTNIGETPTTFLVTDDKSDIWSTIIAASGPVTDNSVAIARCLRAAGGTTVVTVTASGTTDFSFRVAEAARAGGGIWADGDSDDFIQTSIGATSQFCADTTEIDISANDSIVFCNAVADNPSSTGFGTPTPGSGYSQDTAADARIYWQYKVFSAPITNERGGFTSGVGRRAAACIAGFICSASARCFWGFSYCCGPATIRKLDDTGAEVWRYRSGIWDEYATRIAVDRTNDKVYFTGDLGGDGLGRMDAATGTLDFTFGDDTLEGEDNLLAVPADGHVYWQNDGYNLDGTSLFSDVADAGGIGAARSGYLYQFGPLIGGSPVIQNNIATGSAVWSVTSSSEGLIRGVVAGGGDLWAFESSNDGVDPVRRYTFAAADGTESGPDDLTTSGLGCSWVAIDGSDNFYVVTNNVPDSAIYYLAKFNSSGAQSWEVSFAGVPAANDLLRVCVNNSTGDVFVANGTEVRAYNSAGALQWTFDHGQLIYGLDCDDDGNVYLIGEESTL